MSSTSNPTSDWRNCRKKSSLRNRERLKDWRKNHRRKRKRKLRKRSMLRSLTGMRESSRDLYYLK